MRAALISLAGPPLAVAGRSLALRQLDFALAAGCTRVFALGSGASAEGVALRHAAEAAGVRFLAIGSGHALLGALAATEELLVLAPGLLPEAPETLEALRAPGVAVLPAEPGIAAGFERIDRERAWAGVLVVPGSAVERLSQLDPESEPAAALLRVALQTRVPERRFDPAILTDGRWAMVAAGEGGAADRAWLARNLLSETPAAPSARLVQALLAGSALRLLPLRHWVAGAAGALFAGALALAGTGFPAAGLALTALGTATGEAAVRLSSLSAAPFGRGRELWSRARRWLPASVLAVCTAAAIEGSLWQRAFPPLVLAVLLWTGGAREGWRAWLGDVGLLSLLLACAAALGWAEPAAMAAALALLAAAHRG